MKIRRLVKVAAVVQIARYALNRRRRYALSRQRRRWGFAAGALSAAGATVFFLSQHEQTPAWMRRKQRKEARRESARLQRDQGPGRPPAVHVERNASTGLKVPPGDQGEEGAAGRLDDLQRQARVLNRPAPSLGRSRTWFARKGTA